MTKNPFKLKIIDYLPFFGNITSFLNFKESSFKRRGWAIFEKALSISLTFLCAVEIELLYWQFRFFKPRKESVFVSNYRIRTRTLITTNCKKLNNIQFVIAFFPFILTFSFLIRSRYKEQLFSYLVKDTLPGICVSHQNLSWETFREITSKKVVSFSYPFDDNSNISPQKYKYFGSKVASHGEGKYQENHACIPLLTKTTYGKERIIMGEALHDCHPLYLDEKLQNQDFIERLDVSSNLILLEMKPAWEQKQKQFYIGFLPKKNQIYLNKLPLFFDRKQKVGNNEIVHISNSPLQIKNAKNNNKEKFSEHKFYARKLSFLRSYKDKINLKTRLINKKPNLINVFSKQQFQQKFFDLDELPLKLDQNCSEILSSKTQKNQCCESNMLPFSFKGKIFDPQKKRGSCPHGGKEKSWFLCAQLDCAQDTTTLAAQRKDQSASLNSSILITQGSLIPNLFETLQTFPTPIVTSDLLDFSSNKERNIYNIENGIADQTKLLNTSFEENESTDESEENVSTDESERLPLPNEPTQKKRKRKDQEDQKPIFIKELLEKYHKDGEEETFYKKLFLENELKKVFYNSDFFPSTLPKQKSPRGLISSRLMSGYKYSDMEITNLRSSRIQNLYKNIIFQKQNKERISMIIELPSSLLTTSFESQPNQIACIPSHEGNPILTDAKQKHEYSLLCGSEDPKGASSNQEEKDQEVEGLNFTRTNLPYSYHESEDESGDDAFPPYSYYESEDESGDDAFAFNIASSSLNEEEYREKSSMRSLADLTGQIFDKDHKKHSVISSEEDELFIKRSHKIEDFFKVPQLKFRYLPISQTLLNKSLIEKLNISGIYQKVPTIYKQEINFSSKPFALLPLSLWGDISSFPLDGNVRPIIKNSVFESSIRRILVLLKPFLYFQKPFQEFWEPVTIQSWLVITKLSFAFIALKMTQSLLLNYGKELVFLGFLSENLKEEIGLTDKKKNKGYRLIKKVEKRFKDVAGIDNILPELGEMVWILRNSGRSFKVGRVLPKGFLFVGPPGTGKTLLVQAIAGEAEVPVLIQSGSSLTDVGEDEKGAQRLTKLFEQARKVAPCIVFIDEIDTLGESRQNVMSNNVGADDLIQSLYKSNQGLTEKISSDYVNTDKAGNITEKKSRGGFTLSENLQHNSSIEKKNKAKQQANQEQLHLLMQFLVELDGLKSRAGIIVIGATNRPKVLDPALTRPGRFDRVLNLELPGKTKRIEILKLYSQNIGLVYGETKKQTLSTTYPVGGSSFEQAKPKESLLMVGENINKARDTQPSIPSEGPTLLTTFEKKNKEKGPHFGNHSFSDISNTNHALYPFGDQNFAWEYLANRTFGFSAADLAAAMNLSSIQAILRNTGHTIETIEQGIEFITTYSIEKPKIESTKKGTGKKAVCAAKGYRLRIEKDPFFITRFAYYQAGKAVLHTLLPQHPDAIVLKLWPQPKNSRHKNVNKDQEFTSWSLNHRAKLETRLIGLYAGKAAELLALSLNSQTKKQTTYTFTRKRSSTIKETKAPNRKIVSLLRTKDVSDVSFSSKAFAAYRKGHVRNLSQYNKRNLSHSSLGIEDLSAASNLAHSLVEKWHFYSNKIAIRRENQIFTNQNQFEISEIGVFDLFQQLTEDVQNRISASNISESTEKKERIQSEGRDKHSRYNFQEWSIRPWWQNQITEQTGNLNMFYDDWYRIYLPDPEESERNEEWVTPDEYYHNTQNLKNLLPKSSSYPFRKNSYLLPTFKNLTNPKMVGSYFKIVPKGEVEQKNNRSKNKNQAFEPRKEFLFQNRQTRLVKLEDTKNKLNFDLTWNDLYKLDRDYIYHALILTCFNKAFCLLDENRELLDYLADHLMRFEMLRQHKIKQIFYDFGCSSLPNQSLTKTGKKDKQKIKFIFDKNWGKNSRRSSSRLFTFDQ